MRDVERRIQKAEAQSDRELPVVERPAGSIPASFEEYAKLMFDLQVLAYQSDLTRVITFMIGKELSSRTYPEIGVPEPHHPLSHHQNDPEKLAKLTKINTFHMSLFAYYLEKLQATPDGDGYAARSLTLIYGSGMSNSNLHVPHKLPILLARRRGRAHQGRAAPAVCRRDAADEPVPDRAEQAGRAGRTGRRQQRPDARTIRGVVATDVRPARSALAADRLPIRISP